MRFLIFAIFSFNYGNIYSQWYLLNEVEHVGCLNDIDFTNSNNGYLVADNLIGITNNAGLDWVLDTSILGNFRVVDFINLDTGMVCCDPASGADVLITFDGGNICNMLIWRGRTCPRPRSNSPPRLNRRQNWAGISTCTACTKRCATSRELSPSMTCS